MAVPYQRHRKEVDSPEEESESESEPIITV